MNTGGESRVEVRARRWSAKILGFFVAAYVGAACVGCDETTSNSHAKDPSSSEDSDSDSDSDDDARPARSSRSSRSGRSSRASRTSRSSGESGESAEPRGKGGPMVGKQLPDLRLTALNGGKSVRLGDYQGKVILLDVWASWCAPCKQELPMLDDMAGRLRKKGIEIVAVSIDDDRDAAQEFLRSRPRWSIKLAHDPDGKLPSKLQPPKMPSSYLVDRNGVIRQVNAGFEHGDAQKIEARLVELAEGG